MMVFLRAGNEPVVHYSLCVMEDDYKCLIKLLTVNSVNVKYYLVKGTLIGDG